MSKNVYHSTVLVPVAPAQSFQDRANYLRCDRTTLTRMVLVLAMEWGFLPGEVEDPEDGGVRASVPFRLDEDVVERLGGKERARDYVRWAIVEGLDKSPLAPPDKGSH